MLVVYLFLAIVCAIKGAVRDRRYHETAAGLYFNPRHVLFRLLGTEIGRLRSNRKQRAWYRRER